MASRALTEVTQLLPIGQPGSQRASASQPANAGSPCSGKFLAHRARAPRSACLRARMFEGSRGTRLPDGSRLCSRFRHFSFEQSGKRCSPKPLNGLPEPHMSVLPTSGGNERTVIRRGGFGPCRKSTTTFAFELVQLRFNRPAVPRRNQEVLSLVSKVPVGCRSWTREGN